MNREILFMTARVVTHSGAVRAGACFCYTHGFRKMDSRRSHWMSVPGKHRCEPNKTVARDVVGQCVVLEHQAARALAPGAPPTRFKPILLELHHHTVEEQPLRHFKKCPRRRGTHVSEPTLRRGRRAPSDKGVVNRARASARAVWGSQAFGVTCRAESVQALLCPISDRSGLCCGSADSSQRRCSSFAASRF